MDKTNLPPLPEQLEVLRNNVAEMVNQVPDEWADPMVELRDGLTEALEAARAVREAVPDGAVRALRSVANELTATARADCRLSQSSLFHLAKEIHTAIAAPTQDQENGS